MKEADMLKDLLQYISSMQYLYNDNVINIVNPEIRQLFTQMRDDETRAVVKLQQRIERAESKSRIIARILPSKTRY